MSKTRRVFYFLTGLIMAPLGILFILEPAEGYEYVLLLLVLALLGYAVNHLIYYFLLARFKTGGIEVLFKGLIFLDAGLFALDLNDVPKAYGMLYMIGIMSLSGLIELLQGNQARILQSGHWKYQMGYGAGKLFFGLSCLFFLDSARILTLVFGLGVLNMAVNRISIAFRKTDMVYVK